MSDRRIPVLNWIEITPPQPGKNFSTNLERQMGELQDAGFPPKTVIELTCRPLKNIANYDPKKKFDSLLHTAQEIFDLGFEANLHIAARMGDPATVRGAVEDFSAMGGKRLFLIAGDAKTSYTPDLPDSVSLAHLALDVNPGIEELAFGAYPGLRHPFLSRRTLWESMVTKAQLKQKYPELNVVFHTQFEVKASRIDALAKRLKRLDDCPLRVGLLGPTNFSTLLKVAEFAGFSPWELARDKPDLVAGILISTLQQKLPLGSITLPESLNYRPDGLVRSLNQLEDRSDNYAGFYIYSMNNFAGTKELLDRVRSQSFSRTLRILTA